MRKIALIAALGLLPAGFATAETVSSQSQFLSIVEGKTLQRAPGIRIEVKPNGKIDGRAVSWPLTGSWNWQDGYFCRDIDWSGYEIGYNCQKVTLEGDRIRFTSDRGAGDSAAFRLN